MADLALRTSGDISLDVVEEIIQASAASSAAYEAGTLVGLDAAGKWTTTGIAQTSIATSRVAYGILLRKVAAGESVTAMRKGVLDGFNLDALAFNAVVFVGATGAIDDTSGGTANAPVGRVIPGRANLPTGSADKLLFVDL